MLGNSGSPPIVDDSLDPADARSSVQSAGCLRVAWPPPPHDPRERELALRLGGWEVRLFGNPKFEYFVTRGFWHLQLWHPLGRVSVLTPSRLTRGFYEAFPVFDWKGHASTYDALANLVSRIHSVRLPQGADVARVEKALVDDVVRRKTAAPS